MQIADKIEKNVKLAPFTSFKIGGPAKYFLEANSPEELIEAIKWAKATALSYFVLGGGSNILVSDAGFEGLVIKYSSNDEVINDLEISCSAGAQLSSVVLLAVRHGLAGLEWAAGLPGTIGGAIRGNAACFGSSMSAIVKEVEVYDPETDQRLKLLNQECNFIYRHSLFKDKPLVLLSCRLSLQAGKTEEIQQKMQEVVMKRAAQQPKYPSAGSVFKNVPLSAVTDDELQREAELNGKVVGAGPGGIAAGWLIERAHLKGRQVGGAEVSTEHANFIVNRDFQATAEDVIMLISLVKQQIRVSDGVMLKEEIQYVGF